MKLLNIEKEKYNDDYLDSFAKALIEESARYEEHLKNINDLTKQYKNELEDIEAVSDQQKLDLWYKRKEEEIKAS